VASLLVDVGNTVDHPGSFASLSGATAVAGTPVDMMHADTYTGLWVAAAGGLSGVLPIFIQTSPDTVSGNFTDPTSGLALSVFPIGNRIASGGLFYANSGLYASGNQSPSNNKLDNAPILCSGGIVFASFQRPHRYARLCFSGLALGAEIITAGFIGQKRVTGSGGGFSLSPGSGTVSV